MRALALLAFAALAFQLCLAGAEPEAGPLPERSQEDPEAALAADDECGAEEGDCALAALQVRGRSRQGLAASARLQDAAAADSKQLSSWSSGLIRWSNHPGKCLDVTGGEVRNGARLRTWDCSQSSPNQQFLVGVGDGKIRWATHPEYCLDVYNHGDFNGNRVQLWRCTSGDSDQRFDMSESGVGRIRWSNHPSKCLDVRNHDTGNGAEVQIWKCIAGDTDQDFFLGSGGGPPPPLPDPVPSPGPPTPLPRPPVPVPSPGGAAYDVIVVGGGLVGSAVAAGLAERLPQRRVLLLEAGGASQAAVGGRDAPASWSGGRWQGWPGFAGSSLTRYDVPGNYEALQCWRRDCDTSWGHVVPEFQCKILGGCGVMNGALMQLPSEENFETWPAGWRYSDLLPYYESAQSMYTITATPSVDGRHYLDNTGANFVNDVMASHGFPLSPSLQKKAGTMSVPHVSAKDGIRESTTSILLPRALKRSNFEMRLHTEALEVVLGPGGEAAGLRVRSAGGSSEVVSLASGGLLVVSAGALNTPRLLLASGLTGAGQVGKGLSDHTLRSMIYTVPRRHGSFARGATEAFHISPSPDSTSTSQYVTARTGPLTQFGPTLTLFIRDPSTPGGPDVYDVEAWVNPDTNAGEVHLSVVLMRPTCSHADVYLSGGRLHQSGTLDLPCARDRATMDFAIRELDSWMGARGARRVHISPPEAMNHFVGTCKLGRCADADSLLVRGAANVAVADASLLPGQVWGHPALTLTAVALKATDALASWF